MDGGPLWVRLQATVKQNGVDATVWWVTFSDISERKAAENALQQAHDELELKVQERTEALTQANTRLREQAGLLDLAHRELHDSSGQSLTALKLGLGILAQDGEFSENATQRVIELKRITDEVMINLHELSRSLRPPILDQMGLVAALRQHVVNVEQQTGMRADFVTVRVGEERLPLEVEGTIYRVVQEALTNVARHARASLVAVILKREADRMVAIVEDNGQGFDVKEAMERGRLGLQGMYERAELLGGRLVIESECGRGTTVSIEIPITGKAHQ